MGTRYATYMTFSLLEKIKNKAKLYSININKVNKVFKLLNLMQKGVCFSLEIIFSQVVLK